MIVAIDTFNNVVSITIIINAHDKIIRGVHFLKKCEFLKISNFIIVIIHVFNFCIYLFADVFIRINII